MRPITPQASQMALLALLLLIVSLFVNLGLNPLHFEEPRRALIALEMIFQDNWIVPTEAGEYYYKKPPVFNWVLIFFTKLMNSYSEFTFRLVTPLSFLLMVGLVYWMNRLYGGVRMAIYASLLFGVSSHMYINFTRLAEIDIFYSLITFAGFVSLFHFYHRQQYWLAFSNTYVFGAIGMLTKGFPSIVFLGVSIITLLLYHRDLKRLFSLAHISGGLLFCLIVGGYFALYAQYNALESYFFYMWSQASERTVLENSTWRLVQHLFTFPLTFLQHLLPASLLIIFACRRDFLKVVHENAWVKFCFYMFLSNIVVYWLSPGTRPRYVYMFYPLLVSILTYFLVKFEAEKDIRRRLFDWIAGGLIGLVALAAFSLPFIPDFAFISPARLWTITLLAALSGVVLFGIFIKYAEYRIFVLVFTLILVRWVVNFTVIPSLAHRGEGQHLRDYAKRVVNIVKEEPLYLSQDTAMFLTTVFYIERERLKTLSHQYEENPKVFYISEASLVKDKDYQSFLEFSYRERKYYLLKFTFP
ncbi:MAG: phospholipid carrier-dependent glycosyltransferase [Thermonemataceae bacterium]